MIISFDLELYDQTPTRTLFHVAQDLRDNITFQVIIKLKTRPLEEVLDSWGTETIGGHSLFGMTKELSSSLVLIHLLKYGPTW